MNPVHEERISSSNIDINAIDKVDGIIKYLINDIQSTEHFIECSTDKEVDLPNYMWSKQVRHVSLNDEYTCYQHFTVYTFIKLIQIQGLWNMYSSTIHHHMK